MALLVALAACGDERAISVASWRLVGADSVVIHAPAHVEGHLPARGGSYRLAADVSLPPEWRGLPLTLAIPRLMAPVELTVGGVGVESTLSGLLRSYRNPGQHKWRIPAALTKDERLSLELVVQDTWFQATWLSSTPRLSRHPDGDPWYRFVAPFKTASDAAALALMGLAGLSYLLVFLANRRNAEYGWFAAQGLGAASYPFFAIGAAQLVFGVYDVRSLVLVAGAALASVAYTHAHFDLPAPSRIWAWLMGIDVVVAAIAGGPFSVRWGLAPALILTIVAVAIYQMQLLVRLFLRGPRRADAATLLASWVMLSLLAGTDFVHWLGLGGWLEGFSGGGLGLAIFAVLQTSALSREVAARDRQNRRMADELRRQVSARSRQLSHALARLGRSRAAGHALAAGEVIDDRYRVRGRLGAGAMATVYEVERLEDGEAFALKVLNAGADAHILARFAREAHIASEVTHPNVVGIHDIDFASSGFMYVVLELVRGVSLKERADRFGDVSWGLDVLCQVSRGLEAIHQRGVVHRDLKPANILLRETEDGLAVKISDFGVSGLAHDTESELELLGPVSDELREAITSAEVARAPSAQLQDPGAGSEVETLATVPSPVRPRITGALAGVPAGAPVNGAQLTQAGHLLGTPAYMAPELAAGGKSEPSHDIYSFGIIGYELLAGARPFDRVPLKCRMRGAPLPSAVPLGERCPELDPALCELVTRAMAFEPSERPSLAELAAALDAAQRRMAAPAHTRRSPQQDDCVS